MPTRSTASTTPQSSAPSPGSCHIAALCPAAIALADSHQRVRAISPDAAALHTGPGNVMPPSLQSWPHRAGGGEKLSGLRRLNFHHRRAAVQAGTAVFDLIF